MEEEKKMDGRGLPFKNYFNYNFNYLIAMLAASALSSGTVMPFLGENRQLWHLMQTNWVLWQCSARAYEVISIEVAKLH